MIKNAPIAQFMRVAVISAAAPNVSITPRMPRSSLVICVVMRVPQLGHFSVSILPHLEHSIRVYDPSSFDTLWRGLPQFEQEKELLFPWLSHRGHVYVKGKLGTVNSLMQSECFAANVFPYDTKTVVNVVTLMWQISHTEPKPSLISVAQYAL